MPFQYVNQPNVSRKIWLDTSFDTFPKHGELLFALD